MENKNEQYYLNQAAEDQKAAADSFDRCDTDGFVSQFCHGLSSDLNRCKASLARNNWKSDFPGLYDLKGNRMRAKLIDGEFGECWAMLDENDKFTGQFISHPGNPPGEWVADDPELNWILKSWNRKAKNLEKKGYQIKMESAPANAKYFGGSGRGLSGLANVRVIIYRTDKGY